MPKRSVVVVRQVGWVGWDSMRRLVEKMGRYDLKALVAFLFLSGLRVSEALAVHEGMVKAEDDFIVIQNVPLLKRFTKKGVYYDEDGGRHFDTEPKPTYAVKIFPAWEPLVPYFMDYVWDVRRKARIYERENPLLWRFGRVHAYVEIRKRTNLFPHWFRAMRAVQLAVEYGFSTLQLKEFFKWEDLNTVFSYAMLSTSELAKAFPRPQG